MPDSIPCPQCGARARITERFWLDSTDGPVEHLKIGCLSKHWFTPRAETIQREQVTSPDRELVAPAELTGPRAGRCTPAAPERAS